MILPKPIAFEWDVGNAGKNWIKHNVADQECEELFFDSNRKIFEDVRHSEKECRFLVFGKTKQGRLLLVACTMRRNRVRVISARDLNNKEKAIYEKAS